VPQAEKLIDGTRYDIVKRLENGCFYKQITVTDPSLPEPMTYAEKVAAFTYADFESMFARQGLTIKAVFGGYNLQPYNETESKRLIVVAGK
jgi:hypothetical protein